MLRLQKYDLRVTYIPGKHLITAGALSRAVDKAAPRHSLTEHDVAAYVDTITCSLPISQQRMNSVKEKTEADETLKLLTQVIIDGWPSKKASIPDELGDYWNIRAELSVNDGVIYKRNQIVIPNSMRKDMLQRIHTGHLGMEKCKRRAREVMYRPRINMTSRMLWRHVLFA